MLYPCKECAERTVGCHGNCEKYNAAKEKRDGNVDERLKRISLQTDIAELTFASMRRNKAKRYDRKW